MKIIFIRHGEPDVTPVDERGWIGQGRNFAPLTEKGIQQAIEVSRHPSMEGCQIIVTSPYTRALQTAAIISKNTGLDLRVEIDLHEFIPDQTFQLKGAEENKLLHEDFLRCKGEYPSGEKRKWETIMEIVERTKPVFDRYAEAGYDKIMVVAHGGVIRRYTGVADIAHCEVCEVEYSKNFSCFGWV